jgi:hypothetical protein
MQGTPLRQQVALSRTGQVGADVCFGLLLAYLEAGFWLINATLVKTDCMRNTRTRALAK